MVNNMNKYAGKVKIKSEIIRVVSGRKVSLTAKCIIGLVNLTHMLFNGRCMEAVTLHKAIFGAHL